MDVEQTMTFILGSQARAEVRMDRLERQVRATANLLRGAIRIGARQLVEVREGQRQLAESQRVTDQKLAQLANPFDAFLKNFGRPRTATRPADFRLLV